MEEETALNLVDPVTISVEVPILTVFYRVISQYVIYFLWT